MKWFAMWHPELGWGPMGVPVLMSNKRKAATGTGISLKKMRELGWRWKVFQVVGDDDNVTALVNRYLDREEAAEFMKEWNDEDGTSGDDGTADHEVDQEDGRDTD